MSIIATLEGLKTTAGLTPDEAQLLKDYRSLHDEAKRYAQSYMHHYSVRCPRKEPALQLVKGGAA